MRIIAAGVCIGWSFWAGAAWAQGYGQEQQPPSSDMQSGGLAPPPPVDERTTYPDAATTEQLREAEREDSGRGLEFFWLNGEVGVQHLGLQTLSSDNLLPEFVETQQTGPMYGGGLGFRLVYLTLGARFRLADFPDWQLWTLNGELGLRIPIGIVEPYFSFGGGYASLGSFSSANLGGGLNSSDVEITGFDVRGGVGVDFYISPVFSLGANLTGEMLVLTRPGVDPAKLSGASSGTEADAEIAYSADGSSIGSAVTLSAVAGLHF